MTRDEVIKTLVDTYAELDAAIDGLNEATMCEVAIHHQWTIKDMLAHLAYWEKLEAGWIEVLLRGEEPLLYEPGYEWDREDFRVRHDAIERINAKCLDECRSKPLDGVMADFKAGQERMISVYKRLGEDAYTDPDVLFWIRIEVKREPWNALPVNSYEHYRAHTRWVTQWRGG